jgi:cytochrome b561
MRAWANTPLRYGTVAIVLHWAMAVLLVALTVLGLYMVRLPDAGYDTEKITLIIVHKAIGMVALASAVLRLLWRWCSDLPQLASGLPEWQQVTARFVHLLFYALLFALPLTGWVMSSAGGYPVSFFGWFDIPDITRLNEWLFRVSIDVHRWLAYALVVLMALHAVAALHHHWNLRDDTLRRMMPGA